MNNEQFGYLYAKKIKKVNSEFVIISSESIRDIYYSIKNEFEKLSILEVQKLNVEIWKIEEHKDKENFQSNEVIRKLRDIEN